jgi:thiol-disulfide isomerase/thioredoxin
MTAEQAHALTAAARRQACAALGVGLMALIGRAAAQTATTGADDRAAQPQPAAIGGASGPAPDFDLPQWDLASNAPHPSLRLALETLRGRWVYLDFWASWCGPCRLSFPWMNRLVQRLPADRLRVVAIGLDTRAEPMARFIAQLAPRFTVLWDARHATPPLYRVQAMPSSFLIDPAGRIVASHRGFNPTDASAIERDLRQRLGIA